MCNRFSVKHNIQLCCLSRYGSDAQGGVGSSGGARHEEDFQLGGDAGAVGDALGGDEARQRLRVLLHARSRQHHPAPARKRVEQLLRHPARDISVL